MLREISEISFLFVLFPHFSTLGLNCDSKEMDQLKMDEFLMNILLKYFNISIAVQKISKRKKCSVSQFATASQWKRTNLNTAIQ